LPPLVTDFEGSSSAEDSKRATVVIGVDSKVGATVEGHVR